MGRAGTFPVACVSVGKGRGGGPAPGGNRCIREEDGADPWGGGNGGCGKKGAEKC